MAATPKSVKTETEPTVGPAPKAKKTETLFVAYDAAADHPLVDVVVFGRKIDAADWALEQEPTWKVIEIRKGVSLRAAIAAKNGQR